MILPAPECRMGYTVRQIEEMFDGHTKEFFEWMQGQTGGICEGRSYNHDTMEYSIACEGVRHGFVVYPWDVERYILKLPVID